MTPTDLKLAVSFKDSTEFAFAVMLLEGSESDYYGVVAHRETLTIEVGRPELARLLRRFADHSPSLLLHSGRAKDYWLLVGGTSQQLDQTLKELARFIIPTYAEFQPGSRLPIRRRFDPASSGLGHIGSQLFPKGYFRWESPKSYRETILKRTNLWLDLLDRRPEIRRDVPVSYRDELREFESEIAANAWDAARQTLNRIRRANLTSADNLDFLTVELLAQQQRWRDLWELQDYGRIARMRMPRMVRAALLTAFHSSVLLPLQLEGSWNEAVKTFHTNRPRLGRLLTTRVGLRQTPVIIVFALEATLNDDAEAFAELESEPVSAEVKSALDALATVNPKVRRAIPSGQSVHNPLDFARLALFNANYDQVLALVNQLPDPLDQVLMLIETAFRIHTIDMAERAILAFWELPDPLQAHLLATHPVLQRELDSLLADVSPVISGSLESPHIESWDDFLNAASSGPAHGDLLDDLDRLVARIDERSWTIDDIRRLQDHLLALIDNSAAFYDSVIQRAVDHLIDFFLRDQEFPRFSPEYRDLYELMYMWLIKRDERNEVQSRKIIRLADALLRWMPNRVDAVAQDLVRWFDPPRAVLNELALDAFELVTEFGFPVQALISSWQGWVMALLHLPGLDVHTSLWSWLKFGEWIAPDPNLLNQLRARCDAAQEHEQNDAISLLPAGYRIGIFSLRPGSANRVRTILLESNQNLDVRVCEETDLSEQAKALAQSANMAVVVTTCISHALTYGIQPYLRADPVFPESSGSSSIIRAIRKAAEMR